MTSPKRFILRMALFVAAIAILSAFLFGALQRAFEANIFLNGLILSVLILGLIYNFRQVVVLFSEVAWIDQFRLERIGSSVTKSPRLLASMATMLGEKRGSLKLSTHSMRSILDGIISRLDESRDLSRYNIGLLIFLGLLGTFWGLLETVGSIRNVIGGLNVSGGDFTTVFASLKEGLTAPLDGMGTAFSSSLFGLAGSLILGFLDLQASQAQNRFYNDLEEWLSSLTQLSTGSALGDETPASQGYIQALLEQTATSLENLQRVLIRSEHANVASSDNVFKMTETMALFLDQNREEQKLMEKLLESQLELGTILQELSENTKQTNNFWNETSQSHLQNIDLCVTRLSEEVNSGRDEIIEQLRAEIRLLARTISANSQDTK